MTLEANSETSTRPDSDLNYPVVCVYCGSSDTCHPDYHSAAFRLGDLLAENGYTIVYGGGGIGSMGALANGALSKQGRVIGVIPEFMIEREWGHQGITELQQVENMRTRKHLMLEQSRAVVALPGGVGTFEELFEAITLKKLGLCPHPIIIVNTRGYFDPLIELLNRAISEEFMQVQHADLWQIVSQPEDVLVALGASS